MQRELGRVIEQVSKEKGLDPSLVIEAVEEAMKSAARKTYGADLDIEAKYNEKTGVVDVYNVKTVVAEVEDSDREISLQEARDTLDPEAQIGDELLIKLDPSPFGRIAAQAAKQNIVQKVRDYERAMIYDEFKELHNTIQSGIVMRFERRNLIVQLRPNVDAILPADQQIPRERYRQGDRIRALITHVDESARGPQIVLSRTDPELVRKLFEQEVPEVYEGIVEIKDVVREPGGRAKIAVVSHDSDVDPVGACVGMRGSRVQAVVQELRGERIDIVPWTPDETEFVCRALSPAKVSRVVVDEEAHAMEVVVPDDQLSLAIGRKGQNVRLASKLTGWKLDVHGESDYERRQRESRRSLRRVQGLGDLRAELLLADGYKSAAELAASDPEVIAAVIDGTPEEAAEFIRAAADAAESERIEKMVLRVVRAISEAAAALMPEPEEATDTGEDAEAGAEESEAASEEGGAEAAAEDPA
ncbi:MAG: transcription termination factor NusA [Deltaproteobacteria bacterium]|nr:MAG: transcription termination factor NusA [Deltaproteobacteria bacterium]